MQEEITQKTLALCVETGKITAQLLQQAMKKVLADMEKHKNDPQLRHGKQTIRQLMKHGAGVSNIEITDQNIKAFSATAKKYGIDFALKKDTTKEIPRYLVFFKGTYKTNGVSHVGIYVGENRMIHCGNPISYTNINTQYWQSHFFTFGRLP